jgi:hypothetical protein
MMMQGETIPKEENHVRLSTDLKDKFGMAQMVFNVGYDENDQKSMQDFLNQGSEMLEYIGAKKH